MKKRKYICIKKPAETGRSTAEDIEEGKRTFNLIELRAKELKKQNENNTKRKSNK